MANGTEKLFDIFHSTIVRVKVKNSIGTGFWVAPKMIATCAHVVSSAHGKAEEVDILWRDERLSAVVVNYFDSEDIALLECIKSPSTTHPVAILAEEYEIDDEIYSFGFSSDYPLGEPLTCVVEGTSNSPTLIKLKSGQVVPGFSGAPTLNRRTGTICGVLRRSRDRSSALGGRAIPSTTFLSAFPPIAEAQSEIRKFKSPWSEALTTKQKRELEIEYHFSGATDRIAEIYKLLNYDVQQNIVICGHRVDLKLTRRLADIEIQRVVFVCDVDVETQQLDSYAVKLGAIKRQHPEISGTIICPSAMENEFVSQANSHGIQLVTTTELESQLFDSTGYINKIIREVENDPRYSIDLFIEPFIGETLSSENKPVRQFISSWINNPEEKQLTVLGDVGIGKTFLSKIIAYEAALRYRQNPSQCRLPIHIDLRNADRQFTLEGLFLTHFVKNEMRDLSFDLFRHSVRSGRILIILDGFDEMSAKVTPQITAKNFQELARIVEGNAKVMLTCRTHYFRSRSDEEEVVYGENNSYGSDSARDLYWDLISRRGFQIAYMREFNFTQVQKYVQKVKKSKAPEAIEKIRSIYNLEELCQRPMLLEMIVKSIGKLDTKNISAAALYQVFTDAWIYRDKWRDILTPDEKCEFLEGLACLLTTKGEDNIHHSVLADVVRGGVASKISDPKLLVEIDSDVRTSTFLTRDDSGNYGFAHKSYREFFYARSVRSAITSSNYDLISERRLTPEEVGFTVDLLNMDPDLVCEVANRFESIITSTYQKYVSENSLLILIAIRKGPIWERLEGSQKVALPDGIQFQDAILNQLDLHGLEARNADLAGADLSESVLNHSVLFNAKATRVNLYLSELSLSVWDGADLSYSNISKANFTKSSLKSVFLKGSDFRNATLTEVNVAGADLTETSYNGILLNQAIVPDSGNEVMLLDYLASRGDFRSNLESLLDDENFVRRIVDELKVITTRFTSPESANDIVQETFLSLYARKPYIEFSNEHDVIDYIRSVALGNVRKFNRRDKNLEYVDLDCIDQEVQVLDTPDLEFDAVQLLLRITETIPDVERDILGKRMQGDSFREIADNLNMSEHSIRARWLRIVRRIKNYDL